MDFFRFRYFFLLHCGIYWLHGVKFRAVWGIQGIVNSTNGFLFHVEIFYAMLYYIFTGLTQSNGELVLETHHESLQRNKQQQKVLAIGIFNGWFLYEYYKIWDSLGCNVKYTKSHGIYEAVIV